MTSARLPALLRKLDTLGDLGHVQLLASRRLPTFFMRRPDGSSRVDRTRPVHRISQHAEFLRVLENNWDNCGAEILGHKRNLLEVFLRDSINLSTSATFCSRLLISR